MRGREGQNYCSSRRIVPIVPDKNYRENFARSIYITGRINQDLVDRLTPEINRLRLSSDDPITAYIDSRGGEIWKAETIRRLITAYNPDGTCCRLITVVTGTAASAAADFLALGDYAIAHDHTDVIYHGTRETPDEALTVEGASTLSSSLRETNEFFALRLARNTFGRFFMRLTQQKEEFDAFRAAGETAVIAPLIERMQGKFSRLNAFLLKDALKRQQVIKELTTSVMRHLKRFKQVSHWNTGKFEAELLKGVIDFKTRIHKSEPWALSKSGMNEITSDFSLLHDFHYGSQRGDLKRLSRRYGLLLLTEDQRTEHRALTGSREEIQIELRKKTELRLQAIWYFLVSLCRILPRG